MGKTKVNPRYNILSVRVSDNLRSCIDHALGGRTVQDFMHRAIMEKVIRDRQAALDDHLKILGVTEL